MTFSRDRGSPAVVEMTSSASQVSDFHLNQINTSKSKCPPRAQVLWVQSVVKWQKMKSKHRQFQVLARSLMGI